MCDTEFPSLWLSVRPGWLLEIMYFELGEVITPLREFYGAILLFRNENQYFFVFLIKIILKKVFEYVINRL